MIENLEQYKAARLKRETVTLPDSDMEIEIQAMSTGGWTELMRVQRESPDDKGSHAIALVKHGVPAFYGESAEAIGQVLSLADAMFLGEQIMLLSGLGEDSEKN